MTESIDDRKRAALFYNSVLDESTLLEAAQVDGVDGEIAYLRTHILELSRKKPQAVAAIHRGLDLLVRAVAVRYRMSPANTDDLAAAVRTVARQLRAELMPQEEDDV